MTRYQTAVLDNGLRIIALPTASPVVYCGYQLNVGTANELPGEEGIAHFCEHVTFKGTTRRTAIDVIQCLEEVGGDLNAFTTKTDTVYYSAILKDHLSRAIDLLTDIVFHSVYPQKEINKEVEVICDEIESYNDSPAELIYDEFENLIFRGHPLGHSILGTSERVRRFTTDDAIRFTKQYYLPMNSVFFAYGDVDFEHLLRLLEKENGAKVKVIEEVEKPVESSLPPLSEYQPQVVEIDKHTHQAHVMIGNRAYSIHDKRRMALYLLNNILGGPGMSARLNLALRERRGLVYTVESTMVSYSQTGLWSVYFGCDADDRSECMRLVRAELDRFMSVPLSDEELSIAKQQLKGQIGIACDNRENLALDFGKVFLHYGWKKDITALYRDIDAITAEDVQQVACELFPEERLTKLVYI
ncbi:insulinase family protein [Prevotella jejuni]|uniref:Predicted Zn-dependent peptidase n=1 Tax=Prevotella jejuni TaxID=1177574 RepID=A0A2K9H9U1_9BACT|nr:pitrilysin family protein [Prevotella jejuni]AUI55381.1 insulinase family protein [Prevotella jejuni]SNR63170.1 Predicted Zn-dependent peptidase [Prevotella jejuni]